MCVLHTPLAPHFPRYIFDHMVVRLRLLPLLLPIWMRFKDGHLSLNFTLSKHCRENLTPILPEESFRPRFGMLLVDT